MLIVKTLKWIAITLALVVIVGVLYLHFADLNWIKSRIVSAVASATGRELKVNGSFDLDILPTPSIALENVTFSNADWGSKPMMAEVGHFSAEVGLWSLMYAPVRIRNVRLRDVDILLETTKRGESNWTLKGDVEKASEPVVKSGSGSSASAGLPVIIEFAQVRNVQITYRNPEYRPLSASLASLDITTDDSKYTAIGASGQIKDQPFKLTAKFGPEQALVSGTNINVVLSPVFGKYSLKSNGILTVKAQDYLFQDWTVQFKDTKLYLDGSIGRGPNTGTELSIKAAGASLASLDPGLPAIPFEAALIAKLASDQLALDSIDATFGESDVSGAIEAHLGDKTAIGGQLQSKRLDLTPFAVDERVAKEKPAQNSSKGQPESEFVFVGESLPLETLNSIDLDVQSNISQLTYRNVTLADVATGVKLKHGSLHLTNRFRGSHGGHSASDITLTATSHTAKLDMDVKMRNMLINLMSGNAAKPSQIPPVGITLDIESTGDSPRALAASATGRLLVTQGKGRIENDLINKVHSDIVAQLFGALNPFSKKDKFTTLDCTILGFEINKGKMDITGMLFQTEKIKALGTGDIDLNTEALNIKFNTKPRAGVGVTADALVTPFVKLAGTLTSPSVALNQTGILVAGGAAVATGGLSLLTQSAANRVTGVQDSCAAILSEVGDHPPLEK